MLQITRQKLILFSIAPLVYVLAYSLAHMIVWLPEPIGSRSVMFISGINLTISLAIFAGLIGIALGVILGIARISPNKIVRNLTSFYVWLFTGTPLLTQILFVYYVLPRCLPFFKFDEYYSALIALSLNMAAYNADVVRAGLLSVPKAQEHAGLSLGFTRFQVLRFILFPQAMRFSLMPLMNNFIVLLKDSSLASAIGLLDLTLVGTRVISETFEPVPILLTVSGVYLLLTTLSKIAVHYFEKHTVKYA